MSTSAKEIYDKLDTVNYTKQAIQEAITNKGVEVPAETNFYDYASLIYKIPTGSNSDFMAGGEDIGGSTTDNTAEYPVINITTNGTAQTVCSTSANLPFGYYSIIIRMKLSSITTSGSIATVKTSYNGTQLSSIDIPNSIFTKANTWECVAFGVDFSGTNKDDKTLDVTISTASTSSGTTISIDYIRILPSGVALGGVG